MAIWMSSCTACGSASARNKDSTARSASARPA
eukprot:CAMPEP_0119087080 /NCGR_PEP_ID=MMETSP1178-20130426/140366_1 /TAXON_ID=33656 /ORGANISM="unid sp, Strain CCMP2000" /LENGTH=31 /DNA_ID= /DNA_START= /DNA_END= /DNA_ORIENTATION=